MEQVDEVVDHLGRRKAAFRFPRSSARDGGYWARKAIWAVANLIATAGLVYSGLCREVAPVPKAGGSLARGPDDVRPVSVMDDLEVVMETLFLAAVRQRLIERKRRGSIARMLPQST